MSSASDRKLGSGARQFEEMGRIQRPEMALEQHVSRNSDLGCRQNRRSASQLQNLGARPNW